nr:hypothetical protein Itr_chr06CG10210 [Ipomoea trifida]
MIFHILSAILPQKSVNSKFAFTHWKYGSSELLVFYSYGNCLFSFHRKLLQSHGEVYLGELQSYYLL